MEPEEVIQPPGEESPTEGTQEKEQQAEMEEAAKDIELLRVEDHIDEFDLNAKFQRWWENPKLLGEELRREAAKSGQKPEDIMLIGTMRELFFRQLRKPGRNISYKVFIDDEGNLYILTQLF